ncbi:MAG TPA: hypothetical protein DCL61_07370 [Cyanobacteria bacterium UBA12227]|nr:hypothetical protein [Cyanobacteria bacterium UBA12227]HBY77279.1 hypothetical protein [Cyanobacteria bacterium UBA11148]
MTQGNSEQGRLYTRFISILRVIQYLGYALVVVFSLVFIGSLRIAAPGLQLSLPLLLLLLQVGFACVLVYISTQGLIAVVDLLSRIEINTRLRS